MNRSRTEKAGPVAWDGYCDEPVAWLAVGEPVLGTLYGGSGPIAYTHLLTVEEAVEVYGPISEWVVGPGGFRRVCFGETVLSSAELGRGFDTRTLPEGIVTVEDPDLDWPCRSAVPHRVTAAVERPSIGSVAPAARITSVFRTR